MGRNKSKKKPTQKKSGNKKSQQEADRERRRQQQRQREEAQRRIMEQRLQERQPLMEQKAQEAVRARERQAQRGQLINKLAHEWSQRVDEVVKQVKQLRNANPDNPGINAGNNPEGNTDGGNSNPLHFDVPGNEFGVTESDVFKTMTGFDSSDSGIFKFRRADAPRGNVLVHCE